MTYRCIFLTLLLSVVSIAQTSYGRISGAVTDTSGAGVGGAKMIVANTDTQLTRTVAADDAGFYVVPNLPVGVYSVTVDQPGLKRESRTGVNLVADGRITEDFKLRVGDVSQSVEVTGASAEMLNTVSGELSRVIDLKQVDNLALNGRNYCN